MNEDAETGSDNDISGFIRNPESDIKPDKEEDNNDSGERASRRSVTFGGDSILNNSVLNSSRDRRERWSMVAARTDKEIIFQQKLCRGCIV